MKYIFVYPERCTGCRLCSLACSLTKFGECNPRKAAISVVRDEFERFEFPVVCFQCQDAPCITACPQNAITKDEGHVTRDDDRCIGCRLCAVVCPFSAITTHGKELIQCDLCGGDPQCVKYCSTNAIEYAEETQEAMQRRKEQLARVLITEK
ncbi:MAG: 4Fe-4S dicluster domain-containing protein [Promethearchaeota archaeon]